MSKPADLDYLRRQVEAAEVGVANAKAKADRAKQASKDRADEMAGRKDKLAVAKAELADAEKAQKNSDHAAQADVAEGQGAAG